MKKTALMLLSVASVAGLAGIATATPFTAHEVHSQGLGNLVREAGFNVRDVAHGIGLGNLFQGGGFSAFSPGFTRGQGISFGFTPGGGASGGHLLTSTPLSPPVSGVPEGGSTLLLLGAGLVALVLLRRRSLRHSY